jgi:hypothetical protein
MLGSVAAGSLAGTGAGLELAVTVGSFVAGLFGGRAIGRFFQPDRPPRDPGASLA